MKTERFRTVLFDWLSLLCIPIALSMVSYLLTGDDIRTNHASESSFILFVVVPRVFLIICALGIARMVNLSVEVSRSKWFLPIVGVQLLLSIVLIVLPRMGVHIMTDAAAFVGRMERSTYLLIGAFLYNLVRGCYIQFRK